ncbi:MAG: hypothetical protein IJO27_00405 [Bacilli bacterium]|nr:hypothetical protein [Bacilli bacterium]
MRIKPKYKLGQKVILLDTGYGDKKFDYGYITGIRIKRSYNSAGIFQWGGLSVLECEANGYLETYMKYCDEVVYEVIREIHTTKSTTLTRDVLESKIVPYNKENKNKYIKEEFKND